MQHRCCFSRKKYDSDIAEAVFKILRMAPSIIHEMCNILPFSTHLAIKFTQHKFKNISCHPCLGLGVVLDRKTGRVNFFETSWLYRLSQNYSCFLTTSCNCNQGNCHSLFSFLPPFTLRSFLPKPMIGNCPPETASLIEVPHVFTYIFLKKFGYPLL